MDNLDKTVIFRYPHIRKTFSGVQCEQMVAVKQECENLCGSPFSSLRCINGLQGLGVCNWRR